MSELRARVDTDVSPERLWEVVTDWEGQGDWIPLTTSRVVGAHKDGEGTVVHARTGLGPIGFVDAMIVRRWAPPTVLELEHVGRVVRGSAGFTIEALGARGSRITWWERIDPPFGIVGALGWRAATPVARVVLRIVLRRLAGVASARAGQ